MFRCHFLLHLNVLDIRESVLQLLAKTEACSETWTVWNSLRAFLQCFPFKGNCSVTHGLYLRKVPLTQQIRKKYPCRGTSLGEKLVLSGQAAPMPSTIMVIISLSLSKVGIYLITCFSKTSTLGTWEYGSATTGLAKHAWEPSSET